MFELLFEPPKTPKPSRDWCDRAGAEALKARIEAYWEERDQPVQVWIEQRDFASALRSVHYVVRSNIVSGLPSQLERAA